MEQSPRARLETERSWDRPLLVVPLFVLIALVGGLFGSFTLSANLLVLGVGGAFMWVGVTGRGGRRPAPRRLPWAAAWWLVPAGVVGAVELVTLLRKSMVDYPTLSLLADPALEDYGVRSASYLGWLLAFWGLARR